MENIYDGCTQSEKDEIINGLESSFNGQFEKLVERIEGCKTDGEEITLTCSDRNNEGMLQNEQRDKQPGFRKSQANSKIVQRNLELHLSFEAQQKIQDILDEVRQLSEKEKLLLYLKLPTKTGNLTEESQPIPLSNTRQEQTQAFQWIRSSLEECECSYTLPKHEVYDDYKSFCESLGANRTLSAPDFGKIIKCVFPKVKARRLGTRGNSKYCYSGLRKRVSKDSQSHSNVNGQNSDNEVNNNNNNNIKNAINDDLTEDQTLSAACNLVCEWANKLLGRVFTTLIDLARFLVGGSYVSTKSMAAFVVMSATESKVRTMSAKLQFHSSSSSSTSPNSKSISSTRTQSPLVAVSSSAPSERLSGKMPTMQAATSSQSKNAFITNGIRLDGTNERPRSLPGLQIAAGDQESIKLSNLMSPPLCPPPKTANQVPKGILPPGGSPIYADTGSHARGIPSTSFLQTNGVGSFPVLIQQSPQQQLARLSNQVQQESPGKRQILSQRTSLKRSDSCPYPSQSPRGRQIAVSQVLSPMSPSQPNDVIRAQNWQGIIGNQQAILVASPDNAMNKIIQEQQQQQQQQHMLSPIRGTSIIDPMGTPVGRQGQMQRCHSVPAPFNSPQGDIYQPLTPQLRAQVISSTPPNNVASFSQLKETRAKFFKTEIQANARRNLTPSFLSDKEASKVKPFRQIVHERKAESETVSSGPSDIPERKAILANDGIPEAIVTASNSKCYGNALRTGSMMGNQSTGSGSVGSRKQSGGLLDESSLTSVDSLMDSTFSLAGVDVSPGCDTVTSGGNGLNDFDGLDDAETIDLLRSLNSGNNIWVNEWNNTGVQLMESS